MKDNILVRTFTGAAFLVVMISCILLHEYTALGLLILVSAGAYYEFLVLKSIRKSSEILVSFLAFAACWTGFTAILFPGYPLLQIGIPAGLVLFFIWPVWSKSATTSFFFVNITGWLWIIFPFFCLLLIAKGGFLFGTYNPWILLGYFIIIWVNDIMAYLSGRFFGKHKIAPHISPGKSWEGFAGGLLFGVGAGVANFYLFGIFELWEWIIFALITVIMAVQSDLLESKLKREAGVKDSGTLLPGHGGLLDRFDSVLLSAPVILIYLMMINL